MQHRVRSISVSIWLCVDMACKSSKQILVVVRLYDGYAFAYNRKSPCISKSARSPRCLLVVGFGPVLFPRLRMMARQVRRSLCLYPVLWRLHVMYTRGTVEVENSGNATRFRLADTQSLGTYDLKRTWYTAARSQVKMNAYQTGILCSSRLDVFSICLTTTSVWTSANPFE